MRDSSCRKVPLRSISNFLVDMDGTLYLGRNSIPGAPEFVDKIYALGKNCIFLSNNSSASTYDYVNKLSSFGIDAAPNKILLSTHVAIHFIKNNLAGCSVYPVGTPSFVKELIDSGVMINDINPGCVLIGFDKTLTYDKLKKACRFISDGKTYLATHPDKVCPTEDGYIPDIGAIISFVKTATGRLPRVLGKPNASMVSAALDRIGGKRNETAMVGDRLYTDMRMARTAGITAILVLSGETKKSDIRNSRWKPDYVFESVQQLLERI